MAKIKGQHLALMEDYTFDSFVQGENNSFAFKTAIAVSECQGQLNPLIIYGGLGMGKTHLMRAIGNFAHKNNKKIIYVTSHDFTSEFMESLRNCLYTEFTNKYRTADYLLLDDISYFQNKMGSQEELFYTFKALYESKKQMVFSCDRPISQLKEFSDGLKSFLCSGIHVDLQMPNYETRMAILKMKSKISKITIPNEVFELIAQKDFLNVRELETSILNLVAYAELEHKDMSVSTLNTLMAYLVSERKTLLRNSK